MIFKQLDIKLCSLGWFGLSNTSSDWWSNGVGQNRETDEQHDEDCVEEGFQLVR